MKSGYKVYWTEHALNELAVTIEYLHNNFTEMEIRILVRKIENTTELISQNPFIYPKSDSKGIHKAVVQKYNTMYYRVKGQQVEVLSFFSNRQSSRKRRF